VGVGLPAVWLLLPGLVGTTVAPGQVPLQLGIVVALPRRNRLAARAIRACRRVLHERRKPAVDQTRRPPRAAIGARRRAAGLLAVAAIFAVSLTMWATILLALLWIAS
jgi:hypothetical protein